METTTEACVLLTPDDYVLGIADFTGEMMRKCINSVGSGDIDACFKVCNFLRHVYSGYQLIGNQGPKELPRKMQTLRQSLEKVENTCYTIQVRGSEIPEGMEIPKNMLADMLSGGSSKNEPGED